MGANERDPRWSMTALFSTFLHRYHFMLVWQLGQMGGTTRCSTLNWAVVGISVRSGGGKMSWRCSPRNRVGSFWRRSS